MARQKTYAMSDWDILTSLADMAAACIEVIKGRHPRIEYWLKQAEDEAYKAMQGKSTLIAELASIIEACPNQVAPSPERLEFIEAKLAELRALAADRGHGNLALSIEMARVEAKRQTKTTEKALR
jgi:hypothetical protein